MLFDDKKLTPEAITELLHCPVHSIEPYTLMLAPVYVFMKLNQKFVSVKAPLDFFVPEELERLKSHETFYLPRFIKSSVRFQTSARLAKKILLLQSQQKGMKALATYESSNEVLKVMATLWSKQIQVEPFFMAVFTHEFCLPLKKETMVWAREQAVVRHDQGLLLAGAFVFIALHLGMHDYELLNRLRDEIYERTVSGEDWTEPKNLNDLIVSQLDQLVTSGDAIGKDTLIYLQEEWSQKILARLKRVEKDYAKYLENAPSIFGAEGFVA
jgi:hypothetical protein